MTTIALPFDTKVVRDTSEDKNYRSISAKMGEGFRQAAPDGLNAAYETWDILIGPLTLAEKTSALAAFDTVGTWGKITWTPVDTGVAGTYQLKDKTGIKVGRIGTTSYSLSLSLEQVF